MSTNPKARAWVQVRANALRANYARIAAAAGPEARVMPMVKANAYGLGVERVVSCLQPLDPWGFGVATVNEALVLRDLGVTLPIVVCSPAPVEEFAAALEHDVQLSISSLAALARLRETAADVGRVADFHVDVDTGMGRSGFDWRSAKEWLPAVTAAGDRLRWRGLYTHLLAADDDPASIGVQAERLRDLLSAVSVLPDDVRVHVLNSAGIFREPGLANALVRPGIFLFGGHIGDGQPVPDPVVSLNARVVHVRPAGAGTSLGYGATYTSTGEERWATLSIGYGDGLPRALGNRGSAIVDGVRVPIIGRISMDVTVVNISDAPGVSEGSVATLIGTDGDESISIDDVAKQAGTISYEILTGLTTRLPRVWSGLDT